MRQVIICRDAGELNRKAATEFIRTSKEAVVQAGRFTVVLSGGSTPKGLYALLATPEFRDQIPWSQVYFFWGDERCVPPDDSASNYRMVYETLLSNVSVPKENVHRMKGEKKPQDAAHEYDEILRRFFQLSGDELPRFDLIFLGLGEDGHTASLFPGSEVRAETKLLAAPVYVEKLKMYRLTLTLPVLNHGASIFFLVAGEAKAPALRDVLREERTREPLPAQLVKPTNGRVVWWVDQAAARFLSNHLRS